MNALKNKIQSQRGASITFALLLFLVCAIISSVVIVAATAVGGRASKMAELDQRYYAVNSAAELFRDVLEQQTVTVTTGTKTVCKEDQDGTEVSGTKTITPETYKASMNGSPVSSADSLVIGAAVQLVKEELTNKTTSENKSEKEVEINSLPTVSSLSTLDLTAAGTGITNAAALTVKLTPSNVASGKMTISVSNQDTSKGTYTLGLTFKADIIQNENALTTYSAPLPTTDESGKIIEGEYTRYKTVEKTTISTIRWKLIDMRTVVAVAPSNTNPSGGGA